MGGPGSGRWPLTLDGAAKKVERKVRTEVIKANQATHEPFELGDRDQDREVVDGLMRKDFPAFLELVRTVRNSFVQEASAPARGRDGKFKRGSK